jgi:sec-independent protein translocase protein TatA
MIASILFISGSEIFIVLIVVLLLFGSKKIPELAKGLGKGMKEFKRATEDIKREIHESTSDLRQSANEIRRDIDEVKGKITAETEDLQKSTNEIRKDIDKVKGQLEDDPYNYENPEETWRNPADVADHPQAAPETHEKTTGIADNQSISTEGKDAFADDKAIIAEEKEITAKEKEIIPKEKIKSGKKPGRTRKNTTHAKKDPGNIPETPESANEIRKNKDGWQEEFED